MSNHLPECDYTGGYNEVCLCNRLRACEQRVLESEACLALCADHNYQQGLDAAREAVASMVIETVGNSAATVQQALAAIDALRGDAQ